MTGAPAPDGPGTGPPVTVLSGYLGAGKTTLLNGLLASANGRRFGVVVNDFGAVNIDAALVTSRTEDTIELTDGCICCSLRGEVGEVMRRLAGREDLDHVFVEASGIADPAGLASWGSFPGLAPGATVVCADVTSIRRQLRDPYVGDVVEAQVRRADVLVLTRTDLVPEADAAAVAGELAALAPGAAVIRSAPGAVSADDLLRATPAAADALESAPEPAAPTSTGRHTSREVPLPTPVQTAALEQVLAESPDAVVRAKGVVLDQQHSGRPAAVQLSGRQVQIRPLEAAPSWLGLVLVAVGPAAQRELDELEAAIHRIADPVTVR